MQKRPKAGQQMLSRIGSEPVIRLNFWVLESKSIILILKWWNLTTLKRQAGLPSFVLSVSEWIDKTSAIGIIVRKGKKLFKFYCYTILSLSWDRFFIFFLRI